jgi:hypothetical protein
MESILRAIAHKETIAIKVSGTGPDWDMSLGLMKHLTMLVLRAAMVLHVIDESAGYGTRSRVVSDRSAGDVSAANINVRCVSGSFL